MIFAPHPHTTLDDTQNGNHSGTPSDSAKAQVGKDMENIISEY